jgi:ankyrin repeat protein
MTNDEKLLYACENGLQKEVKKLISTRLLVFNHPPKANINVRNKSEWTPLHVAIEKGFYEIAKMLIEKGADVNAINNRGRAPMHYIENLQVLKKLIEKGANINEKDKETGWTPLHFAVTRQNMEEIVDYLITNGADVNAKSFDGSTPLHLRLYAKRLIAAGGDVNSQDEFGNTPLHYAHLHHIKDAAEPLINAGADVNSKNKNYSTPLHLACSRYSETVNSELHNSMEKLDNLFRSRILGQTFDNLENAPSRTTFDVISFLISKGADVEAKDKNGKTALDLASQKGLNRLSYYLLQFYTTKENKSIDKNDSPSNVIEENYNIKTCHSCGKKLTRVLNEGTYTGDKLMSTLELTPYPCKSCGTIFCMECMAKLKNIPCPACKKSHGW